MIENTEDLRINHNNFRQNRKAYGITIEEIAKKCGLSSSVVSNYENFTGQYTQTRHRDDNARRIVRALKDLIQSRIGDTFITIARKEDKEEKSMVGDSLVLGETVTLDELVKEVKESENGDKKVADKYTNYKKGYNKEKVVKKLRAYCDDNNISFGDFCKMCGINHSTLAPYSARIAPILSEKTMEKIFQATGWDRTKFEEDRYYEMEDRIITVKSPTITSINNKKEKTTVTITPLPIDKKDPEEVEIKDKKYTFQDGICYEEYTEVRYIKVKKVISKEQFMEAIA